jgi:hypothetical protein
MAASRRHRGLSLFFGFAWGLACCTSTRGVDFAGGTGEPNNPYQIANAAQLLTIGSSPDLAKKHYVLVASLDMSGAAQSKCVVSWFYGTLDGKGHTIRNLRMEAGGMPGLFGLIDRKAEVRNLGLVDIRMAGSGSAGGLAMQNEGRVVNCYCTGTVTNKGGPIGGLVGWNNGTIIGSYASATITGSVNVGGLVGLNPGTVSSCYATGEVIADSTAGGLVGFSFGTIRDSHFVGSVSSLGPFVGGLVGDNSGPITSSYAEATVAGQSWSVGGLVGEAESRSRIVWCHAKGSVTGQESVGGLAGRNSGSIEASYAEMDVVSYGRRAGGLVGAGDSGGLCDCYSTGSVEGEDDVGGLVGYDNAKISTSYSIATVLGYGWQTGGLVGQLATAPTAVKDCYFLDWPDGGGLDNGIGTALTSAQMKQQASFAGWDFWGTAADGANDAWFMPPDAYPALVWQTDITGLRRVPEVAGLPLDEARLALTAAGLVADTIRYDFSRTIPAGHVISATPYPLATTGAAISLVVSCDGMYIWTDNPGDGTAALPYRIETAGQLESLIDHPDLWDKHFILSADLDMTGRTYSKALIAPDVDDTRGNGFQGTPFRGSFDGQGHTIRNLIIHQDTTHDYVGLFGMIGPGARIDNLTLLDADVIAGTGSNSYVGALAGYNQGTITNCRATGFVRYGRGDGLVGFNAGTLIDCRSDVIRS